MLNQIRHSQRIAAIESVDNNKNRSICEVLLDKLFEFGQQLVAVSAVA